MDKKLFAEIKNTLLSEQKRQRTEVEAELLELINAINKIDGVYVAGSCIDKEKFEAIIWFRVDQFPTLNDFCREFFNYSIWKIVYSNCDVALNDHLVFYLDFHGENLEEIFKEATKLAFKINSKVDDFNNRSQIISI